MRQDCIDAVTMAIGRQASDAEIRQIEQRINNHMHRAATQNPTAWRAMSPAERVGAGAQGAFDEFMGDRSKKAQRVALQITADSRNVAAFNDLKTADKTATAALVNRLEQVDTTIKGVRREYFSNLMDTIEAADPKLFGMMENPAAVRDFLREVMGQKSGNQTAAAGAKAWLETIEAMRMRFNASGGDIGTLDYGYVPQPHDNIRVLKAGQSDWAARIMPKLDRKRYTNDDGTRMSDAQLEQFLFKTWDTISSDGLNKVVPGTRTGSGIANRGADHRQIHFKDADSYLEYMDEFGQGTVFDAMQGHVSALSRDIALVEEMGPSPAHMFGKLQQMAEVIDKGKGKHTGPLLITAQDAWNALSGHDSQTQHAKFAAFSQGTRNYVTAAKLQGTLLSSFSDVPTMMLTANFNRLPMWDLFSNTIKSFGKEYREYANTSGLVADSIVSDMNRWAEGNLGQGWSGKLANATMKLGLMNAWQDSLRRGYSITQMASFGKLSRTDWKALDAVDREHMARKGITEADWQVMQLAKPESWRGNQMLTPEAIRDIPEAKLAAAGLGEIERNRAASRMLGFIVDESEYAVVGPDLMARASVSRGTQKGTINGEFRRNLALFTTFPKAMLSRHVRRAYEMETTLGQLGYAASLGVGLTLFGALSIQAKDLAIGKDPRDMTGGKFWAAAFFQGGGAGIYGDMLYTGVGGNDRNGAPNWSRMAGPVYGTAFDLANVTLGNIGQMAEGKDTKFAGEAMRFARANMPFVNLWYAKGALDHAFYHEMLEYSSPGYLANMRARVRKDYNQGYWWQPGGGAPDRAPNLNVALGG